MRSIARRIAAVLVIPVALGCAEEPADDAALPADTTAAAPAADTPPAELTAANDAYIAAWNREDPAAVAAFFTEDAVATVGDSTWRGPAEISRGWIALALPRLADLTITTTSLVSMGADYHGTGTYTFKSTPAAGEPGAGTTVDATGRFEAMWTRGADGQWKIRTSEVQADPVPSTTTGM